MHETRCDVTFADKVKTFSHDYLKCCIYIAGIEKPRYSFTKKMYSQLILSSQVLEDFLDFHGAKNSSDWFFYRELVAAVRHISLGGYSQKHILNRLVFYGLADADAFRAKGEAAHDFITTTLVKMAPVILNEARRLNIAIPEDRYDAADFPGIVTGERLPFDIDDVDRDQQKENIVKIASEFLSIARTFDEWRFYEPYDYEGILSIVPEKVNEVEIRRFEMVVHNLQSSFDTYVIHGGYRFGNRKLKQLRGHFSVVLHLLQIIGRLLHFFERHLNEAGYKNTYQTVGDKLSDLVSPERLLDHTINYGLYYACHFLTNGKKLAQEIMNENIERSSITVGVPQKLGFHVRPSLMVAKVIQHYGGEVQLCVGKDRFDAGSVLDIQWAGGKIQKENVQTVVFEGDTRALNDIRILAGVNYGEDTMGKGVPLPKELHYLK